MSLLGTGLHEIKHYEDALSVQEACLSLLRRHGAAEFTILGMQNNLAVTYENLGRFEEALRLKLDVYSGSLKVNGIEHKDALIAANNYAWGLIQLERFEEVKALLRKTMPVARRVLGESHELTFKLNWIYGRALYRGPAATFEDRSEAVTTLEDAGRTARRVLGGAHPLATSFESELLKSRAALRAREASNA